MNKWCEHIIFDSAGHPMKEIVYPTWKFCPVCAAPRPERAKTLSEKLSDAVIRHKAVGMNTCGPVPDSCHLKVMAQAAYEHFAGIIDQVVDEYGLCGNVIAKKRFKETL